MLSVLFGRSRFVHQRLAASVALVAIAALALLSTSFAQILGKTDLHVERRGHTATQLTNGRILIVGGENANGVVGASEIFDPALGSATIGGSLVVPRAAHSASLLSDGRVLIAGGRGASGLLSSTEIFDPASGQFLGVSLRHARAGHSATTLSDGRIAIAGGDERGTVELIDPATMTVTAEGLLRAARSLHGAALLSDGTVLLAGGIASDGTQIKWGEIYYPEYGMSLPTGLLTVGRSRSTMRVLPDGKVQVIGGSSDNHPDAPVNDRGPAGLCGLTGCTEPLTASSYASEYEEALCAWATGCGVFQSRFQCRDSLAWDTTGRFQYLAESSEAGRVDFNAATATCVDTLASLQCEENLLQQILFGGPSAAPEPCQDVFVGQVRNYDPC